MDLIIFTTSFPYDFAAEQTFIGRELPYLSEKFDRIILVPQLRKGVRLAEPVGEVDDSLAVYLQRNSGLGVIGKAFLSGLFYKEIFARPSILFSPAMLKRLIGFAGGAELTGNWFEGWLKQNRIDVDNSVFYTYWFDYTAMGLGLAKDRHPRVRLASRAHGYDVYEERFQPPYWPCRRQALSRLDKLFLASEAGRQYLLDRYREFSAIYQTARLGVRDSGFVSGPSGDGVFRIVSCSSLTPVKRVGLILMGIDRAARLRPTQKIEWTHFGDGPEMQALQGLVRTQFPVNATADLAGNVPNDRLLLFYKEHPVDIFINTSEFEGTPISIMEAASCGIPIIATGVGGNPEIVSDRNGLLLKPDPTPDDIAEAILKMLDDPRSTAQKRVESRKVWQEGYNAEDNFRTFAQSLQSIRHSAKS